MPSNCTFICVPCRKVVRKEYWFIEWFKDRLGRPLYRQYGICPSCKGRMENMGKHWSPPKKNNNRAWKRIAQGDVLWNHYRVQRPGKNRRLKEVNYRSNSRPNMGG